MKKRVIDDLRNDELLKAQELDSILIQAGITLDEAPPVKPQATGPALAAQDQSQSFSRLQQHQSSTSQFSRDLQLRANQQIQDAHRHNLARCNP